MSENMAPRPMSVDERQRLRDLDEITPAMLTHKLRLGQFIQYRRRRLGTPEYEALCEYAVSLLDGGVAASEVAKEMDMSQSAIRRMAARIREARTA